MNPDHKVLKVPQVYCACSACDPVKGSCSRAAQPEEDASSFVTGSPAALLLFSPGLGSSDDLI